MSYTSVLERNDGHASKQRIVLRALGFGVLYPKTEASNGCCEHQVGPDKFQHSDSKHMETIISIVIMCS